MQRYFYLAGATGNALGLVNDSGVRTHTYDYSPTGTPRPGLSETVVQPYRYAGAYAEPTRLYKMGARSYDRNLGRFTQPDPSGHEANPYLYAGGDPINNTDRTGLFSTLGAIEGLGKSGDLINTGVAAVQGDARSAWTSLAGAVVGAAAGGVGFYTGEIVSGVIKR